MTTGRRITDDDIDRSYEALAMLDVCRATLSGLGERCDTPHAVTIQIDSVRIVLGMLHDAQRHLHDVLELGQKAGRSGGPRICG